MTYGGSRKVHSLSEIHEQFRHDWRKLQSKWQVVAAGWHDEKKHRYEREFWREFEEVVPVTLEEIDKLHRLVLRARHEVS